MRLDLRDDDDQSTGEIWMAHFHHGSDQSDQIPAPDHIPPRYATSKMSMSRPQPLPIRFTSCALHPGVCPSRGRNEACTVPTDYTAMAWCSPLDTFRRSMGIYMAFKRATEKVPDAKLKGQLWKAFIATGAEIPKKRPAKAA